jgi:hypothetical protein
MIDDCKRWENAAFSGLGYLMFTTTWNARTTPSITKFLQVAQVSFKHLLEDIARRHASNRPFLSRADMELKRRCARIARQPHRLGEPNPKEPPAPEITLSADGTTDAR